MEKRVKVILHRRDGWGNDHQLLLTPNQVKLMRWMFDNEMVDIDTWVEDATSRNGNATEHRARKHTKTELMQNKQTVRHDF